MNPQERLRELIDDLQLRALRASVPADRLGAILALVRVIDKTPSSTGTIRLPTLVTGFRLANLGGNKALRICLESAGEGDQPSISSAGDGLDAWALRFLQQCEQLAEAELVLSHSETGFMRMIDSGNGFFDAWIATKRAPTSWRERADYDWWSSWLSRRYEPELGAIPEDASFYFRLAQVHLKMMSHQLGYPSDAVIGGCSVQTYRDVLGWLIASALKERDRGTLATTHSELSLVTTIAAALGEDPALIGRAVDAFTLDQESAAYHSAVPGVASAPIIRVGPDQLVLSFFGLTKEPLLFLTRELKRQNTQEYNNTGYLREIAFREDLYGLFRDKRFVTSLGRIKLRREGGDVRTDIDAAVFDRKNGSLGLFELKSHDPFARSAAELERQRDNFLYSNRQLSGVLDWLNRHGADEILGRIDTQTAKTFRAQKVYPFVLGRFLAHFSDGPEPDRRAAWGTWPQVLRLTDGRPFDAAEGNPIASLFTRLTKDTGNSLPLSVDAQQEIDLGAARIIVHPSYAAYQSSMAVDRSLSSR